MAAKKQTNARAAAGKGRTLTAKKRAAIDRNFDSVAALFCDDADRKIIESAPVPAKSKLDILLERLYQLPIDEHDPALAERVIRFFDEVGSGRATTELVYDAFMLGVELQEMFPEFRKQIAGRENATRTNKNRADEWKEYAQNQFKEIRAHNAKMPRHCVVKEAIKRTRFHFGIRPRMVRGKTPTWPSKRIQSDIFKGMK